jgi:hypothetical protein
MKSYTEIAISDSADACNVGNSNIFSLDDKPSRSGENLIATARMSYNFFNKRMPGGNPLRVREGIKIVNPFVNSMDHH